jgi:large subunit ribosomal protein L25
MSNKANFEIDAEVRELIGKGASRRLRRQEQIPGVVYGGGKAAQSLTLQHNKMMKALENEAFYSHILTLKVGSEKERVVLKDLQRHAYKPRILHVDFQRVRADEKLHMSVPLHFIGADKAPGVKEGGLISHMETDAEVTCLPDNLPEYLEIDISEMVLNATLHLSDIKLPKGVELVALNHHDDKPVVSIHLPRAEEEPIVAVDVPAEVPATAQKSEDPAAGKK